MRFICGTQNPHKQLERCSPGSSARTMPSSTLPASMRTADFFETLLGEEDAILRDELNHASIIDGIRLCKAKRYRYRHADLATSNEA